MVGDGEPDYGSIMVLFLQSCRQVEFSTKFDYVILKGPIRDSIKGFWRYSVSLNLNFSGI